MKFKVSEWNSIDEEWDEWIEEDYDSINEYFLNRLELDGEVKILERSDNYIKYETEYLRSKMIIKIETKILEEDE